MTQEQSKHEDDVLRTCLSPLNGQVPDMPAHFHAQWTTLVKEDTMKNEEPNQPSRKRLWTRVLSVAAALVFIVGGTMLTKDKLSLTASESSTDGMLRYAATGSYDEDAVAEYKMAEESAGTMLLASNSANNSTDSTVSDRKIIRTVSMTVKTTAYEDSMQSIQTMLSQYNAYLESSSEYTNSRNLRTASLTIRVPAEQLDDFLSGTDSIGRVTSRDMTSTDVTANYQDTAARLENQRLLLSRLQALTDTAADLSSLLELENQIADTQYNIERLEHSLASTDQQVSESTVYLTLSEEAQPDLTDETKTLGERIESAFHTGWNAFITFLQDCIVFLTAALPFIAVCVVIFLIVSIIRKVNKKHR